MSTEQSPTLYEQLGGEEPLRKLLNDFYDAMATYPYTQGILQMHPADLSGSRQKLFEFLSGWTGGPQLFIERHGHPRLRARHMPFRIGIAERDQWLLCFHAALKKSSFSEPLQEHLWGLISNLANHMRNQAEGPETTDA
jgi:hemoglobin